MEVLLRYLSPSNAEGTLIRSMGEVGIKPETLSLNDVPALLPRILPPDAAAPPGARRAYTLAVAPTRARCSRII